METFSFLPHKSCDHNTPLLSYLSIKNVPRLDLLEPTLQQQQQQQPLVILK